ncbi:histidine phosphatase family protein [Cyanobium gracile UHCC 0139]|uniref:Histidine phosphatase family protein n=1 Tax=Cyanobium gracile UHCC 0139 TaxID=3110308 RepID=A0ABU5RQQ6_9CYAN|nr:histidine phosphatase family protein [Cyanobium gracile]MEA5390087.1 histidine phosphatase family protein [Cyanobium gracile UHCC 0139]
MTTLQPEPAARREVILIRHGETEWSLSGQHTGSTDIPLTAQGEEAARGLAPLLARHPFSLVLCSPLQRARRTCELAGLGAQARLEPDLVEWDYGAYEGLTTTEIQAQRPGWMVFRDGCPDGESPAQVGERVDRVIGRLRQEGGRVALVAHGHLLRVFVARWIGLTPGHGAHFLLDTATLTVLSDYRGLPAVQCWNAPLAPGP